MKKIFIAIQMILFIVTFIWLNSLTQSLQRLFEELNSLKEDIKFLENSRAYFTQGSINGGFQSVRDGFGNLFYVRVNKIEMQRDGYKIELYVGNPGNVTFQNVRIFLQYGEKLTYGHFTEDDKETTANITYLPAGYWVPVVIVLPNTTQDEINFFGVVVNPALGAVNMPVFPSSQ